MSTEKVIELSISETQALRAKLGLPPLRGVPPSASVTTAIANNNDVSATASALPAASADTNDGKEILSLSIDETNALRLKIGLPPLNVGDHSNDDAGDGDDDDDDDASTAKKRGSSKSTAIHLPPPDTSAQKEAKNRIEDMAAKREASERLRKFEKENEESEEGKGGKGSAADFARRMMRGSGSGVVGDDDNTKKRRKKKKTTNGNPLLSMPGDDEDESPSSPPPSAYTSADLEGLKVSHLPAEFASGSTTVLTLADKSILYVDPDSKKATGEGEGESELVNVDMDSNARASDNLRRKRRIELGAGRAGGYAGYDDDEFEEMGGAGTAGGGGANRSNGIGVGGGFGGGGDRDPSGRGFALGADGTARANEDASENDIFSGSSGGAVSLRSRHANRVASDFLSHDDAVGEDEGTESKEERLEKERARQARILDKLRRKDKKKAKKAKKKHRKGRKRSSDDSEEDGDGGVDGGDVAGGGGGGGSLLASLEATAVQDDKTTEKRKRRRRDGDGDTTMVDIDGLNGRESENTNDSKEEVTTAVDDMTAKRKRFDQIMEKGKARTDKAFNKPTPARSTADDVDDANEDDAFLNAALAKARRLKRLKELNNAKISNGNNDHVAVKGEDAVVRAVEKLKRDEVAKANSAKEGKSNESNGEKNENGGGITFEFDEMQEFTRALRAREDQAKRGGGGVAEKQRGRRRGVKATVTGAREVASPGNAGEDKTKAADADDYDTSAEGQVEDVDMQELAREMNDDHDKDGNNIHNDDEGAAFGSTASSAPIGRGMSNFLSLLKHTGEIKKHATKEEMRGRAKDKRTYEDYEKLDLEKVVNINDRASSAGGTAQQQKDLEFANREIKLEYRDDYGRLLTRKEAYRNMCYQFHGHGSSKKNQERRLKQIEREREEAKLASRQAGGTLGALKATQKATGKAFIIHKT